MANLPPTLTLNKNSYITLSLSLVIMLGGALITATTWLNNLEYKVEQNTGDIANNSQKINQLTNDGVNAKVQLSEIQTQLKNIDTNILDIKQRLTDK